MRIGILIYNTGNLGDWYQTAAALYVWWSYFNKPKTFLVFLNTAIKHLKMNGHDVLFINRDKMSDSIKPPNDEKVILLCNGWMMHMSNSSFDFPPPDWITPIYTSMHISNPKLLLSSNVVSHFKKYGPIGCRDLSTLKLLKDKNIDAFFSGCLSICFNLRDPQLGFTITTDYNGKIVNSDIGTSGKNTIFVTQKIEECLYKQYIIIAVQSTYNLLFASKIRTTRLHVWLPLISNGANCILINRKTLKQFVEGDPDNQGRSINRFNGLIALSESPTFDNFKVTLMNNTIRKITKI